MAIIGIADAAKLAGKDRRTIERHLNGGTLSCTTDAAGRRVIDTSELARVFGPLSHIAAPANVAVNSGVSQSPAAPVAPSDDGEKAALRAHIGTLERQLDARTDEARELRAQVVGLLEWRRPDPAPAVAAAPMVSPVSRYTLKNRDIAALLAAAVGVAVAASWSWQAGYRLWFMV